MTTKKPDELANVDANPAAEETAPIDPANDPRRPVQIKLFKDNDKYKEALYVNINDYNALIPRGQVVTVPYYVKMHIEEMLAQDQATASMIAELVDEFEGRKDFLT
ncbi:MAG: hypothetical protein ACOYU3_07340 [Bacillota bacterium]